MEHIYSCWQRHTDTNIGLNWQRREKNYRTVDCFVDNGKIKPIEMQCGEVAFISCRLLTLVVRIIQIYIYDERDCKFVSWCLC